MLFCSFHALITLDLTFNRTPSKHVAHLAHRAVRAERGTASVSRVRNGRRSRSLCDWYRDDNNQGVRPGRGRGMERPPRRRLLGHGGSGTCGRYSRTPRMVNTFQLFYVSMTAFSTSLNHVSGGATNAGLTDNERAAILPGSLAFEQRCVFDNEQQDE